GGCRSAAIPFLPVGLVNLIWLLPLVGQVFLPVCSLLKVILARELQLLHGLQALLRALRMPLHVLTAGKELAADVAAE
uniref:Si:dkeyp-34f6.4 n=1 Tax=Paramormyrops kingsleyae TaxID=1676925 RepID=A0A3B3RX91_9TELE